MIYREGRSTLLQTQTLSSLGLVGFLGMCLFCEIDANWWFLMFLYDYWMNCMIKTITLCFNWWIIKMGFDRNGFDEWMSIIFTFKLLLSCSWVKISAFSYMYAWELFYKCYWVQISDFEWRKVILAQKRVKKNDFPSGTCAMAQLSRAMAQNPRIPAQWRSPAGAGAQVNGQQRWLLTFRWLLTVYAPGTYF